MSFATQQASVQSGQPVELLEVTATPVGLTAILVASDDFEGYANTAELLAAWPETDPNNFATFTLDTAVTDGGAKSVKAVLIDGTDNADHFIAHTFPGLTPNAPHRVTVRCRLSVDFGDTAHFVGIEAGADRDYVGVAGPFNEFVSLSVEAEADASGNLEVRLGVFVYDALTGGAVRTAYWAKLQVSELLAAPGVTTLRYTSADVAIPYDGNVYAPANFERSAIRLGTGERTSRSFDLTIPRDHALADLVRGRRLAASPIEVTVSLLDRSDLTDAKVPFVGQVASTKFSGPRCVLTIVDAGAVLQQVLPRRVIQRLCPFMLYHAATCGVDPALHVVTGLSVTAAAGRSVTIAGLAAAIPGTDPDAATFYDGGVLLGPDAARGHILSRVDDTVTLLAGVPEFAPGTAVDVLPGCGRIPLHCHGRYDNIVNHGGEPGMPVRNNYTGSGLA